MSSAAPLPRSTVLRYALGGVGQNLLPMLLTTWLLAYYTEREYAFLLSAGVLGTIRMAERIVGAVLEPIVGHMSDRLRTRFGRRRPFMALGLPLLCLSFVGIWTPPAAEGLDDPVTIAWVAGCLAVFFASYTAVFAPYNALLPEMHRGTAERVRLSTWMSLFEVMGTIVGSVAAAPLVGLGALTVAGVSFANGFVLLGIGAATIAFATMVPVIVATREPPPPPGEERHLAFSAAVLASIANGHFVRYGAGVFAFRMATNLVLVGVPFVGVKLMGLTPGETSFIPAVIIVVAVAAFPLVQRLAAKHGKARVFRWGGLGFVVVLPLMGLVGLGPIPPVAFGGVLFFLSGFSVATLFVLPRALLADIIDEDAERIGMRREAIYTGMSGVVEKLGEAFATGLSGWLLAWFGQSADDALGVRLLGVAAAGALVLGLWGFRGYRLTPAA